MGGFPKKLSQLLFQLDTEGLGRNYFLPFIQPLARNWPGVKFFNGFQLFQKTLFKFFGKRDFRINTLVLGEIFGLGAK